MRLLTWNINGVRTLPQYHPWNTFKTFDEILQHLEADIICFQEMKSGRKLLSKDIAVPASFDAFFSFPQKKTGYSGVATYTRTVPLKAEEGLSGLLQPKPALTADERISKFMTYPPQAEEDEQDMDYNDLDSEGRAIVVDFGLFVLINTYCPNGGTGTPEREKFKMDYHAMLETRVKNLVEQEKRQVIVVGDLNACAAISDHCEGHIMVAKGLAEGLQGEEGFWGKDSRRWIRDWLQNEDGTGGSMVDVLRRFWPERKGMYTCWNTKISARESNYGTRIDFILVTPGLLPWIKAGDIQPDIKGSDHCPVYIDFHDEITTQEGMIIRLSDVLGARVIDVKPRDPPRLSAHFWEEFSGKQTSLQQFFGSGARQKSSSVPSASQTASASSSGSNTPTPTAIPASEPILSDTQVSSSSAEPNASSRSSPVPPSKKRKILHETLTSPKKPKKKGQQTIASFFSKPSTFKSKSSKPKTTSSHSSIDMEDEDYRFALQLSQSQDPPMPSSSPPLPPPSSSQDPIPEKVKDKEQSKQAWTTLLAPIQPPLCKGHNEPAKEFTVNKPGPNKGKKFFICPRAVGPGYDKGKAERMREHVDPQYRCDFFKWSSDVRRNMMSGNGSERNGL